MLPFVSLAKEIAFYCFIGFMTFIILKHIPSIIAACAEWHMCILRVRMQRIHALGSDTSEPSLASASSEASSPPDGDEVPSVSETLPHPPQPSESMKKKPNRGQVPPPRPQLLRLPTSKKGVDTSASSPTPVTESDSAIPDEAALQEIAHTLNAKRLNAHHPQRLDRKQRPT